MYIGHFPNSGLHGLLLKYIKYIYGFKYLLMLKLFIYPLAVVPKVVRTPHWGDSENLIKKFPFRFLIFFVKARL